MNFFRRFREVTIVAALLAIPFFFLNANLKQPTRTNALDRLVLQVSSPIQWVATQTARGVSNMIEQYVYLVDVGRDNERLRYENARLRQDNQRLQAEAQENQRLRNELQFREELGGELLTAQVISKETSPNFRVIRISLDRGERDRVQPGMPVISSEGVVGRIRRTWGHSHYSDVLMLVDSSFALDVVIQRTGARGVLRGTGATDRYLCRLQYLLLADEVQNGDLLFTSGHGHDFPANLLVGRVKEVVRRQFGLYQEVTVEPTVNFSQLEEVQILIQESRVTTEQNAIHGMRPNTRRVEP
ncbi:MAG: rod shape-determining protein MreC [Sandaracinaceae bacterium]|nr:rod shape-determining protein MreC [Sandaracinaceae bacterium]